MKSIHERHCHLAKRAEDPCHQGDGKGSGVSWQRSVKRKLPSGAFELPPQSRKADNATSQMPRPFRRMISVRKSLSDPIQIFGDCDESDIKHRSFSGNDPSDCKDRLSKDHQQIYIASEDIENALREKRRGLKPGLKDSTNVHPKGPLKHICSHKQNEILVLKQALRAEKEAHLSLQAELDEERNAANSAANEAMLMIARLQEEKAAVLMEARQFKRMAEEREVHNQEAISLLKEMLMSKEEEALVLENELATCKNLFLAIEAGDPIGSVSHSHLDTDNYGKITPGTEMISCGSKYSGTYSELHMILPEEDPANTEFNERTLGRSFKRSVSDSIRGNLQDFFNVTRESIGHVTKWNDVYCKDDMSESMDDKVPDYHTIIDVHKSYINIAKESIHSMHGDEILEQPNCPSVGKSFMEQPAEPLACCADEQSRSLWERIMKLEHRLEKYGADGRSLEFIHPGEVVSTPETPAVVSGKAQMSTSCWDGHTYETINLPERETKEQVDAGRSAELQCTLILQRPELDREDFSTENQMQASFEVLGENVDGDFKQAAKSVIDLVEDVHDIYEVHSASQHGSVNESCKYFEDEDGRQKALSSPNKPDSPSELMAPVMETMSVTPPDSAVVKSLSSSLAEAEEQQLNKRLQVLQKERHKMHKAILSLQAENTELKALQDVGSQPQELNQLQNLKRSLQTFEQPNKRVKSDQPLFTSVLRGFLSYFPSGNNNIEGRSMAISRQDLSSASFQTNNVGLSHLLEKSPHLKTDTLITRGLKVKVPAAV